VGQSEEATEAKGTPVMDMFADLCTLLMRYPQEWVYRPDLMLRGDALCWLHPRTQTTCFVTEESGGLGFKRYEDTRFVGTPKTPEEYAFRRALMEMRKPA
jgi:hypothetical protein